MSFKFIGSWISGTMREEDLIPSFMDLLGQLDPERRTQVELANPDIFVDEEDRSEDWLEQASMFLNEDLFDILNEFAPAFFYFGAHPGDGSDYGFWFDPEAYQTAVSDGEVAVLSDLADADNHELVEGYDLFAVVSDHGNVSLYQTEGKVLVWEVV